MRKDLAAWNPEWKRIGLGTGVGTVAMVAMTGLGAWMLERELIGLEWMNYLAALILLVSSFAGAKTAGVSLQNWTVPVLTGAGLWLMLLLIHTVGFGGAPEGAGATALAVLGGSGAAMLLNRGGGRRKGHGKRRRNR